MHVIQILEESYIMGSDSHSAKFRIEFQVVHGIHTETNSYQYFVVLLHPQDLLQLPIIPFWKIRSWKPFEGSTILVLNWGLKFLN